MSENPVLLAVRIPETLHTEFRLRCVRERVSMAAVVRKLIEEHMERKEQKAPKRSKKR